MSLMKLNIMQVCGRLTKDPQLKETPTGKLVMELFLAYPTRSSTDKNGSHTSFLLVEAWERLAEKFVLSLKKGMQIVVKGELVQNRWENDQGERISRIKLVADNIEINDLKRRPFMQEEETNSTEEKSNT